MTEGDGKEQAENLPAKDNPDEKTKEFSARDIIGLKTTIDPEEIPGIPAHKFLMRSSNNENNDASTNRYEFDARIKGLSREILLFDLDLRQVEQRAKSIPVVDR